MHEEVGRRGIIYEACSEIKKANGILMRQMHETGVGNKNKNEKIAPVLNLHILTIGER